MRTAAAAIIRTLAPTKANNPPPPTPSLPKRAVPPLVRAPKAGRRKLVSLGMRLLKKREDWMEILLVILPSWERSQELIAERGLARI